MSSKFWMLNAEPQPRLYAIRKRSLLRRAKRHAGLLICAGMLLGLGLLLMGCATTSCEPAPKQPLPSMPALQMEKNLKSYSLRAAEDMKKWREMLTTGKTTQ